MITIGIVITLNKVMFVFCFNSGEYLSDLLYTCRKLGWYGLESVMFKTRIVKKVFDGINKKLVMNL